MTGFSRRGFLRAGAAAGAALALGRWPWQMPQAGRPWLAAAAPANRVVHCHSDDAPYWDYVTGWYGDYVNQAVVDAMTDQGVVALTGALTVADAWRAIIPAYAAGQKVAIKINLNNAECGSDGQVIDALPQPINSVIRGLKALGVPENDIWVYDVTNAWHNGEMPARLVNRITAPYPNVQFHANQSGCSTAMGYSATERIRFNVPPGRPSIEDRPICRALTEASYLINMPIMKKHGMAGVTLGFKNHFGSFDHCELVHWSVELGTSEYTSSYNALVDIYNNPHFKGKTVLTVGDGLYAARIDNYSEVPSPWPTFGNKSPNSLFFSTDPVAVDCVMYDFLEAEGGIPAGSDDYLKLASASGLGVFEHWDGARQYRLIDYRRLELSGALSERVYLPVLYRAY